jgi:peroxiredoxin
MLNIGDAAPDFELLDSDEKPVKLSDFRGHRVVLFFYPKAATPGSQPRPAVSVITILRLRRLKARSLA